MRQTINIASGAFAAALAAYLAAHFDNEISKILSAPYFITIFAPFINLILFLMYGIRSVVGIIIGLAIYKDVSFIDLHKILEIAIESSGAAIALQILTIFPRGGEIVENLRPATITICSFVAVAGSTVSIAILHSIRGIDWGFQGFLLIYLNQLISIWIAIYAVKFMTHIPGVLLRIARR